MEKLTLKSIVEMGKRAKIEKSTNGESKFYFQLMLNYHNDYAIYYDNRIGDISNNDDEYTRKCNWHNTQMDKFFNQLKSIERAEQSKQMEFLNDKKYHPVAPVVLNGVVVSTSNSQIENDSFGECLKSDHPQLVEKSEMITIKIPCDYNYDNCSKCDIDCVNDIVGESGDEILIGFGIQFDYDNHTISYPLNLNLNDLLNIIDGACNILDNCEQYDLKSVDNVIEKWDINEYHFPDESKQYYINNMMEYGDDTAFDYHGTYLTGILHFLIDQQKQKCLLPNGTHDDFLECDNDDCVHFGTTCKWCDGDCGNNKCNCYDEKYIHHVINENDIIVPMNHKFDHLMNITCAECLIDLGITFHDDNIAYNKNLNLMGCHDMANDKNSIIIIQYLINQQNGKNHE